MVDLCHPLGWQSGWQVCAPYIPSHSPLAARLPPNQKILQDIMRYAPKVDRWLLRSAETSMLPSFPFPSFSSPLVQSAEYGSRMWFFGGKVPLVLVHRSRILSRPQSLSRLLAPWWTYTNREIFFFWALRWRFDGNIGQKERVEMQCREIKGKGKV